jgi:hypothetical protein
MIAKKAGNLVGVHLRPHDLRGSGGNFGLLGISRRLSLEKSLQNERLVVDFREIFL